jgi:hypothetical protein
VLWLPAVASCAACCWGWAGLAHQGQGGRPGRAGRLAAACWGCASRLLGWGWGGRRCLCACAHGCWANARSQSKHTAHAVKEISYRPVSVSGREDHAGAGGGWWIIMGDAWFD